MKFFAVLAAVGAATASFVDSDLSKRADVCKYEAGCEGSPSDTAATFAAMKAWAKAESSHCLTATQTFFSKLTADNYALADKAIHGKVVNVSVGFIYNSKPYYINSELTVFPSKKGTTSACQTGQASKYAQTVANGFNQFCTNVQNLTASKVSTRYDAFDALSAKSTMANGPDAASRFYAATKSGIVGKPCEAVGISF